MTLVGKEPHSRFSMCWIYSSCKQINAIRASEACRSPWQDEYYRSRDQRLKQPISTIICYASVELRTQPLAHWSRHAHQFARQLIEGVAQAIAQASSWKQRPHTAGGAVKAIGEGALYLVRRLNLKGRVLKVAIGRGKGGGTLGLTVPQMPEHTAADDGGQIHLARETVAVLFIGQDMHWCRGSLRRVNTATKLC